MTEYVQPINVASLERWGALLLRPTMHITARHPELSRLVEEVNVHYPLGKYDSLQSPASTGTFITYGTSKVVGRARYIRVWAHNLHGFPAHRCQVFLDRILFNGRPIETERSPLHWADLDDTYEYPYMRFGFRNGRYIDVCACDSVNPNLQAISEKAKKGYHQFSRPGRYIFELVAQAIKPCSFGKLSLTVLYDDKNWENLQVISAREGMKWFRWV